MTIASFFKKNPVTNPLISCYIYVKKSLYSITLKAFNYPGIEG